MRYDVYYCCNGKSRDESLVQQIFKIVRKYLEIAGVLIIAEDIHEHHMPPFEDKF